MKKEDRISLKLVRKLLSYDSDTGIFVWKPWSVKFDARWAGRQAGTFTGGGYLSISIGGENYLAHRLAWFHFFGEWPNCAIDHRDRNRKNNAITNLRLATALENSWNRLFPADTGIIEHNGLWQARMTCKGKVYRSCFFESIEEARKARIRFASKLHGEFACLPD